MSATPIVIPAAGGAALRGQLWPGGPTWVLLAHAPGANADLDQWRTFVPYLLGRGWTSLSIDLRGHGASDGEWDPRLAGADLTAATLAARRQGAACVVLVTTGETARLALDLDDSCPLDGLALLSPTAGDTEPGRGRGLTKIVIAGAADPSMLAMADAVRARSIGPARTVSVPGAAQGIALLDGERQQLVREHLLAFILEQETMAAHRASGHLAPPDLVLSRLGIRLKGDQS